MCNNYHTGDLYWNKEKQVLVTSGVGTCPPTIHEGTVVAMSIPLDKDILDVLGFQKSGNSFEDNNGHIIKETIDAFEFNGIVIVYLNDLQEAIEDSGGTMFINDEIKAKLIELLKNKYPPVTVA